MRLAAISDMHGNAVAFEAVLTDLKHQAPDAVLFLGDAVMRGPQPQECVQMLRELEPLVSIRGNYDHFFTRFPKPGYQPQSYKEEIVFRAFEYDRSRLSDEDQQWLGNLALEQRLEIEGKRIDLFHAAPWNMAEVTWPWAPLDDLCKLCIDPSADLVLFGHVHHSFVRQARGRLVVNTGSIGSPFDGDNRSSYAIIDIEPNHVAAQIRRVAYDVEAAIEVARDRNMPDVEVFAHAVRYAAYPYSKPVAAGQSD